jgi:hypothetical protein
MWSFNVFIRDGSEVNAAFFIRRKCDTPGDEVIIESEYPRRQHQVKSHYKITNAVASYQLYENRCREHNQINSGYNEVDISLPTGFIARSQPDKTTYHLPGTEQQLGKQYRVWGIPSKDQKPDPE